MFYVLLTLLIIDSIALTIVVLLQSGKGGGLAAMGGGASSTDTFFGGRQAVTILTKVSWWGGGIFLGLALILAGLSARGGTPTSVLEGQIAPPAPVSSVPLPLDVEPQQPGGEQTPTQPPGN